MTTRREQKFCSPRIVDLLRRLYSDEDGQHRHPGAESLEHARELAAAELEVHPHGVLLARVEVQQKVWLLFDCRKCV